MDEGAGGEGRRERVRDKGSTGKVRIGIFREVQTLSCGQLCKIS